MDATLQATLVSQIGTFGTSTYSVLGAVFVPAMGVLITIVLLKKGLGWFRRFAGLGARR